ncbi:MAG: NAD(P)/FAD-dependent oxidoreductase [Verrucomicrobia bacterium]|nr:NAD(P)/FAD-dependent oxidoreductase [Verrucomicrobiota bacterium]
MKIVVIGGGAAGVFAAIAAKEAQPEAQVILLEKSAVLLSKVKISGGGRCNVTHSCFDPKRLIENYPRGGRELLGPFHRFQPQNTIEWFAAKGVELKREEDGRMFPITDSSQTIIDCLLSEAKKLGVEIRFRQKIINLSKGFLIEGENIPCDKIILATGNSAEGHRWAEQLGHTIESPVPSLFTFNVPTSPLKELSGVAVESAELRIPGFSMRGPLLITHFGFSGPAALKLSAWGARVLHEKGYKLELQINWLPDLTEEKIYEKLLRLKEAAPQKSLPAENLFNLPKNLWKTFAPAKRLNDLSFSELRALAKKLHADPYQVDGKTTHKEEFVTCGGVRLKEVDFKTMESKICPGLYFAGEVLDIDGVTGGFNFQNAWTTGHIAGTSAATCSNPN